MASVGVEPAPGEFRVMIEELLPASGNMPASHQWGIFRGKELVEFGRWDGSREFLEGWTDILLACWIAGTVRPLPVPVSNDTNAREALAA